MPAKESRAPQTGQVPAKAILYFLNELGGDPAPQARPVNALLEVSLDQDEVQQALNSFDQTVQHIEQCRAARNWPAPSDDPPVRTCTACDWRWNCQAAASMGRTYPMRHP
jgi:putative RecB family exonuclease